MTEFKNILQELFDAGVKFLIVGGYATIAHGYTRATEDLDIWIEPTIDNARKIHKALEKIGVDVKNISVEELIVPYTFFRIGENTGRKIDIISNAEGLEFNKSWRNRYETEFFGLTMPFLSLQDLILNKKTIGRHKDLADVESLQSFHHLKNNNND